MNRTVAVMNVTKEYSLGETRVAALRDVSLDIRRGEFLCIAGPSGSGKTTLLNLIGCVDTPTKGAVEIAGKDTRQLTEDQLTDLRLHTLGFIFQSFNLIGVLDVFRNVELPLRLQGELSSRERRARVTALLERVGLAGHAKHRPGELSGGQRQRVAIARALVAQPQVVLADEPTANLDSVTGQSLIDLMKEINMRDGTTFIFSTHDPRVLAHADAVVTLVDGRVAEDGRIAQRSARSVPANGLPEKAATE